MNSLAAINTNNNNSNNSDLGKLESRTPTHKNKTVRFSTIEIIEFAYTLEDEETITTTSSGGGGGSGSGTNERQQEAILHDAGPKKLTIDWSCQKRSILSLDMFELYRPKRRQYGTRFGYSYDRV